MILDEDPRFKNLERKIGIFVVVALTGIVIAAVLFGLQKDFFTKKYSLNFSTDRGTGFLKGMPVKLSGFRVGRVTAISLNNMAKVDIGIEIDSDYGHWIRKDSTAKLVKEGLVGDSVIDISVGSPNQPQLKDNDSIIFVETKGLDEMAAEIAQKVKPVLIEISEILSYINNPDGDLKKTIRNAEQLTRKLEETRLKADNLLVSATGNVNLISTRTSDLLERSAKKIDGIDLNPTISKANSTLDQINNKLPPLLEKADTALGNVNKISYETRLLSEKAFPKIPGVISQVEELMFSSDRLINSLQNSWLIGGAGAVDAKPVFIPGDSHE